MPRPRTCSSSAACLVKWFMVNGTTRVTETCPGCLLKVTDDLLERPDGTFMDATIYCEVCDYLVPVTGQAVREVLVKAIP